MWFLEKVFLMIAEILSLWLHRPLIALLMTLFRLDLSSKFHEFRYNHKVSSTVKLGNKELFGSPKIVS